MVTFLCLSFFDHLYSRYLSSKLPGSPPPPIFSPPSTSPDKKNATDTILVQQPAQNLEILAQKNVSYLTVDEKYFSQDDMAYFRDKYPSPTRKPHSKIRWKPGDFLGQGSFGTVVMGFNAATGEIMAVKQVNLEGNESNEKVISVESEIELLMQLEHPNIVRYLGTSRSNGKLNIFLEYVSGGSIAFLLKKYGKFNESIVRRYTMQILKGLEYLHWNKVLHRDIKGANVLVDKKGVCKVADFGSSKRISELLNSEQNTLTGTANWMAPEVVKQSVVSRYSDIWSLGCTVIEMITGQPPWSEFKNPLTTMFNIAKANEPPKLPLGLSPELADFLEKCLKIVPGERPNCRQLLEHAFITGMQPIIPELESQSPEIRRKIGENDDFFEIKLRGIKTPVASYQPIDFPAPQLNNNAVSLHLEEEKTDRKRSLFDPILIRLTSKSNSNSLETFETPKNQVSKPRFQRKNHEKKRGVSIERRVEEPSERACVEGGSKSKGSHPNLERKFFGDGDHEVKSGGANIESFKKKLSFEFFANTNSNKQLEKKSNGTMGDSGKGSEKRIKYSFRMSEASSSGIKEQEPTKVEGKINFGANMRF